jgi:pimeloyl-[acyl-carrier protein] methyl ester esterase
MNDKEAARGRSMSLYSEVRGAGPDVVLLHGWGLHAGVWDAVAAGLAPRHRVSCIDLPGHGRSGWPESDGGLASFAAAAAAAAPERSVWVGWSLGGLVALHLAATRPERVRGLALVAATPRFVQGPDWPHATEPRVLEQFSEELVRDYRGTLLRFLALEALGSEHAREELRTLRQRIGEYPPQEQALRAGLAILRAADLRPLLGQVQCPVLLLFGARDRLVPAAAGAATAQRLARTRLHTVAGAAHAPFLSHPQEVLRELSSFLDACGD